MGPGILLLLQLLGVFISAALGLMYLLVLSAPALGAIVRGGSFTLKWPHAVLAGVLIALAIWQAVVYGFIGGA